MFDLDVVFLQRGGNEVDISDIFTVLHLLLQFKALKQWLPRKEPHVGSATVHHAPQHPPPTPLHCEQLPHSYWKYLYHLLHYCRYFRMWQKFQLGSTGNYKSLGGREE